MKTIKSHRQMLRRICTLSQVAGWAMIAMGLLGVGVLAFEGRNIAGHVGMRGIFSESANVVNNILTGLAVLGMVQFIRYVVEEDSEPGWLLRNGHIILCLFALSPLLTWGLHGWPQLWVMWKMFINHPSNQMIPMGLPVGVAMSTLVSLLPTITTVLCFLGIAASLRSVLPILAESKTLA